MLGASGVGEGLPSIPPGMLPARWRPRFPVHRAGVGRYDSCVPSDSHHRITRTLLDQRTIGFRGPPEAVKLGLPARSRGISPRAFRRVPSLLATLAVLHFSAGGLCAAATAIVPDDFPTVQLGIDSNADTIVVRAGT